MARRTKHVMNRYLDWLYHLISRPTPNDSEYHQLINYLYTVDFYSLVPNDDNRIEDGINLRSQFLDLNGGYLITNFDRDQPCSLLEMLIALAQRMEQQLVGSLYEKSISECFWIFMENLDLISCDDSVFNEYYAEDKSVTFLERKYDFDGFGGLFPQFEPEKDQREVEIWYQMSEYLLENYPI